jgi:TonB family protein
MKTTVTSVLLLLLLAAHAAAQTPEGARDPGQGAAQQPAATSTPGLVEAARLNNEAVGLYAAGKYEEALPLARRIVELRAKELGASHTLVGAALLNVAAVEGRLALTDEARKDYRRAAAIFEKGGDESLRSLITAVDGLARLETDIRRAIDLHKRGLALKEKVHGPESIEVALTSFNLGHFYDLLGDDGEAERRFRRFLETAEKGKAGAEDDVAVAYLRLACIAGRKGERDEAAALEAAADKVYLSAMGKRLPFDGGIINGKAVSKPPPSYPEEAKRVHAQGTITVEILVGEAGVVLGACAQRGRGHQSLKRASEFAAYRAQFTPTSINGKPVKVRGIITYNFVLQ